MRAATTHDVSQQGDLTATSGVLAIDGGGSKTDVVVLSLEGALLARERGTGTNPQVIGVRESVVVLDGLVERALTRAPVTLLGSSVYLAGMDLPAEIATFRRAAAAQSWLSDASVVDVDLFALLRAGTSAPDAVAVVCGTGINAVGVRADGATSRFASLGRVSGDWGGGGDLGAEVLWHAVRAEDGRGPQTALRELVLRHCSASSVGELVQSLHFGHVPARTVTGLAPLLFEAAESGDPIAASVVDRQAEEIATMAVTSLRRLDLLDRSVPVVLGGSVLAASHPGLIGGIERALAGRAPLAHIELVTAPPILGAGLLALEHVGADGRAVARAARELSAPGLATGIAR
ncbi:N-acetylglucosamine kinase [Psychromicrobium xiongbiense]|uniref:N-acetylglucosamine kinase n=1 Tax=Psychromicrobium xiongbiense TaxID=3051184 RepID=UPI00255730D9|nr:BadF/BadG/BcrA/BcrD ATPase family protein [Psychromicrobium sp. YIM S02556]